MPALTARLDDGPELAAALRAALEGEVAYLPLEDPPFEQTTYALEIHVPGAESTFLLLADPTGLARNGAFPLRLRPFDEEQARRLRQILHRTETLDGHIDERVQDSQADGPMSDAVTDPRGQMGDPLVGRAIGGGKFEIESIVGSGGAGRVYRARHRDLAKTVAVKVLHPFFQRDPHFASRFQGEALAASTLDHPNVLRVIDFGQ
ncbi:MAG: serine/threonine protein kinase, partial [Myxococcaceae bacterium]|nr:serine/threonine protein kinase [Myxococcaceae bacterium]